MQKITYLDGLRGVAAFAVLIQHYILGFYPALFFWVNATPHLPEGVEIFASGSVLNLFYNGNFAVCIFFVLSGFVLSYKFFVQQDGEGLRASAIKRYFRLAGPVVAVVLTAYILMKFSLFYNVQAGDLAQSGWLGQFWTFPPNFLEAMNQAFVGTFLTGAFNYDNVIWTISYEFQGAFLILGFLALFGKMKYRHWFYLAAGLVLFQTYYLAFILGMFLSDLKVNHDMVLSKFDSKKILRIMLLLAGLVFGAFPSGRSVDGSMYAYLHFMDHDLLPMWYHIVGAFMVMLVLLDSYRIQKILSWKPFLQLGKISFSMYLFHFVILGSFSSFIFLKLYHALSYPLSVLLTFALSLPLIFFVGWASQAYIEKGCLNLSQWVYAKVFEQA